MMLPRIIFVLTILASLSGCGYHLVGQSNGDGVIPKFVETVSIQAAGNKTIQLLTEFRRQMALNALQKYKILDANQDVPDEKTHVSLRLVNVSETYAASAFDPSGIAMQYRFTIRASLQLFQQGALIWDSGKITTSGDVYVVGGSTDAEASRSRLGKDLRKAWSQRAIGRLQSGF